MGGKKKKAKPPPKKQPKYAVPNSWDCPLCFKQGAFHVKINKKDGVGEGQCRACKTPSPAFSMKLTPLTQKVDVFLKYYDIVKREDRIVDDAKKNATKADDGGMAHHRRLIDDDEDDDQFEQEGLFAEQEEEE